VDAHFGDAFANRFAVTKIAVLGRAHAVNEAGAARFVFQG
jgi:hypothetical protein